MRLQPSSRRTPIGIDANGRFIHAVQLSHRSDGWRIEAAASIPRPVAAASLQPEDVERLVALIDRQGFRGTDVVLAVPGHRLLLSELKVPAATSVGAFGQIARGQLASSHKCDPQSLEVASWEMPAPARARDGTRAHVVGCETAEANETIDYFEAAGMTVRALDVESWAAMRACGAASADTAQLSALLNLGWTAAHLVVLSGGTVIHERLLPDHGLRNLHAPFAEVFDLDLDVTNYILGEIGLDQPPPEKTEGSEVLAAARQQITAYLDGLAPEVQRSLSYVAQEHGVPVAFPLLLHGDGASIPGAAGCLSAALGEAVETIAPGKLAVCDASLTVPCDSPSLITAFGLAQHSLGSMQFDGVNLVPAQRREAGRRHRRSRAWVAGCAVYALAWVATYVAIQATMASDDRALRAEIEQVRGVVAQRETAVDAITLDRRHAAAQFSANLAVGKQPDWSILLALLSETLEDEIVLRSVRLVSSIEEPPGLAVAARAGSPAVPVEPSAISLDFAGLGQSQAAISRFVLRLEETTLFRSVKLLDTRREPFLHGHAIAFRVECVLDEEPSA